MTNVVDVPLTCSRCGSGSSSFCSSALDRSNPTSTLGELTQLLQTLPDWVQTLLGGLMALAAVYVAVVFILAAVAQDRRGLVRDLSVGAVLAVVAVMLIEWIVQGSWPSLRATFDFDGRDSSRSLVSCS